MSIEHSRIKTLSPLIRSFYDWVVSNDWTPYIEVNVQVEGTNVPKEFIKDDKITLNIAPAAVKDLHITSELIDFYARFSGVVRRVQVPIQAVLAIYARENARGIILAVEEESPTTSPTSTTPISADVAAGKGKPALKIVK